MNMFKYIHVDTILISVLKFNIVRNKTGNRGDIDVIYKKNEHANSLYLKYKM